VDSPDRLPPLLPVACSLTGTPGAFAERMAEYQRLFRQYLTGRTRTAAAVRFRFRAEPGVEDWIRDLARREKACCAFFDFTVTADGQEVRWDASVADDQAARQALDEFYRLPHSPEAGHQAYEPYRAGPSGS
jgi:hypothetical protein